MDKSLSEHFPEVDVPEDMDALALEFHLGEITPKAEGAFALFGSTDFKGIVIRELFKEAGHDIHSDAPYQDVLELSGKAEFDQLYGPDVPAV